MEEKKMKTFMDKDFLLQTETAKKLYNDYACLLYTSDAADEL